MSTQDNLASQEKIVVNGRHNLYGHRKVDLCVLKEIGVQIQHCLIGVHIRAVGTAAAMAAALFGLSVFLFTENPLKCFIL